MNKRTVALCYPRGVSPYLLGMVRDRTQGFGLRSETLITAVAETDLSHRTLIGLNRGFDLVVIVTNFTPPLTEYRLLGNFNHDLADPWPTCVAAVSSSGYEGIQPTVAIESSRYLGHFKRPPAQDFWELLEEHRQKLWNRGLSEEEWGSIMSYAKFYISKDEWENLLKLRQAHT